VCKAAGIPIAGGHSIDSVEPIYGLVAIGIVHPASSREQRRAGGRCADLGKGWGRRPGGGIEEGMLSAEGMRR